MNETDRRRSDLRKPRKEGQQKHRLRLCSSDREARSQRGQEQCVDLGLVDVRYPESSTMCGFDERLRNVDSAGAAAKEVFDSGSVEIISEGKRFREGTLV
ncbi:hypothetical protein [Brevibacterium sediminis]|uniref:hypothetical protein n=1 Tax=Brevibacterium sediminis TaxID=1857024 RepID=UPI001663F2D9|nr:hypothetical protein [Brevibacterium sediminis]